MNVFGETQLNSFISGNQLAPATATLTGGGYVATWVSTGQDGRGGPVQLDSEPARISGTLRVE